jgi:hypothetical protein
MRRLLILTTLAALTSASVGCCGMGGCGNWFGGRRDNCGCPNQCGGEECGCNECGGGRCNACEGGAMMGTPVMTAPATTVVPGPAYQAGFLPR